MTIRLATNPKFESQPTPKAGVLVRVQRLGTFPDSYIEVRVSRVSGSTYEGTIEGVIPQPEGDSQSSDLNEIGNGIVFGREHIFLVD